MRRASGKIKIALDATQGLVIDLVLIAQANDRLPRDIERLRSATRWNGGIQGRNETPIVATLAIGSKLTI